MGVIENGANVAVRARPTGSFPDSPVEVTYTFTLTEHKITHLEIK